MIFELATQLATRLDRTNRKLGDLAFVDVTGRVAHAIMDLCREPDAMTHPDGMQIKVSRQELSRLVGCSREMAGRVLKVLEDQGLVRASGKTIVVFNARRELPKARTAKVCAGRRIASSRERGAHSLESGALRGAGFVYAATRASYLKPRCGLHFSYAARTSCVFCSATPAIDSRQAARDELVGMVLAHEPAISLLDLVVARFAAQRRARGSACSSASASLRHCAARAARARAAATSICASSARLTRARSRPATEAGASRGRSGRRR